jgi:cell division protein ZapA
MADRKAVRVQIFGKTYSVRADADAKYTQSLARYVEEQMQNVAANSGAVDTQKIAVLAALNIANNLFQAEKNEQEREEELDKRTDLLLQMVEDTS